MKNIALTLLALITLLCTGVRAQETLSREAVVQDLHRIVNALETYHPNAYHYTSPAAIATLRDDLAAALPAAPSAMDAYRALSRLTCAFGEGHTRVWDHNVKQTYRAAGGTFFPLDLTVGPDHFTVRADHRGLPNDLSGRTITAVNGIPAARLITELSAYASRETAALDRLLISGNIAHYLWLTYDWATGDFPLTFADGSTTTVKGMTTEGLAANRPAREKTPLLTAKQLSPDVYYLHIDNFEARPKTFRQLFKTAFATINASGASHLVLDLRGHGGGDSRVGVELARYLSPVPFRAFAYSEWKATASFKESFRGAYLNNAPKWLVGALKGLNPHTKAIYSAADGENARVAYKLNKPYGAGRAFAGEITLLMDGNTFSAGTCFAAMFKDYEMGTIVGQESGNLANFHADGLLRMGLAAGNAQLQVSTSYLVRPSGDETPAPVQPDVRLNDDMDALAYVLGQLNGERPAATARK